MASRKPLRRKVGSPSLSIPVEELSDNEKDVEDAIVSKERQRLVEAEEEEGIGGNAPLGTPSSPNTKEKAKIATTRKHVHEGEVDGEESVDEFGIRSWVGKSRRESRENGRWLKNSRETSSNEVLSDAGSEGDDDDDDDEEYEIEKILNHRTRRGETTYEFLIKWKDYDDEDNTWEPEANLALSGKEAIEQYWKTLPSTKQTRKREKIGLKGKKDSRRKGKIASVPVSDDDEEDEKEEEEGQAVAHEAKVRKRVNKKFKRVSKSNREDSVDSEEGVTLEERKAEEALLRAKWLKRDRWEKDVAEVITIVRPSDDLLVQLRFKNGDEFHVRTRIANEKCPQKMLSFYEDRISFKVPIDSFKVPVDERDGN